MTTQNLVMKFAYCTCFKFKMKQRERHGAAHPTQNPSYTSTLTFNQSPYLPARLFDTWKLTRKCLHTELELDTQETLVSDTCTNHIHIQGNPLTRLILKSRNTLRAVPEATHRFLICVGRV